MTKDNEQKAYSDFYNFVIIGAGPAGLTSGIVAARHGFKAIIIEKGEMAGPKPRGEPIRTINLPQKKYRWYSFSQSW